VKLKLDENLGNHARVMLEGAGHDVSTVVQQHLQAALDDELILHCKREGRALVTLDLDFANPLQFNPAEYPGIAVLRLPAKPASKILAELVRTLVGALEREPLSGQLWIVEAGRLRIYQG
jgi:predicted nuclease of predicted toxin-antitoxin system